MSHTGFLHNSSFFWLICKTTVKLKYQIALHISISPYSLTTASLYFFIFLIMIFKNKFIYLLLRCVFIAARGLSLVAASGGYSSLWCAGFSLRWLLSFRSTGSRRVGFSSCGSWALERRLSSCGAQAQLLRSMWDLRGPGLEPVSPALADGFLTTAPPAMSLHHFKYLHKSSAQF